MTEEQIIAKVRVILNEAGEEKALSLLTEDTVKLSDYIRSSLPDAVSFVQMNSPLRYLNKKVLSSTTLTIRNGEGMISVPNDFIRLISVKVSSWKRPCFVSLGMSSEAYKCQFNSYTRTGVNKPLCFYGLDASGKRLYLYPCQTGDTLSYLNYEASYSSASGIDLDANDPLLLAVCYMAASLVYSIFENKESADRMAQIAVKYIPTT